jgi:membrane protease YdiL (CAAX protease family)
MPSNGREQPRHVFSPKGQVFLVWTCAIAGPPLLALAVVGIAGVDMREARQWWSGHQYVQAYLEAACVGLVPLALTLYQREGLSDYGVRRGQPLASVLLSVGVAAAFWAYQWLRARGWLEHAALPPVRFPWAVWYALLGVVANGPLEVFFVFWLVRQTDRALRSEGRRLSGGLALTVLLFGLLHLVTTQRLENALSVAVVFLLLGLIFQQTRNALGPMLGWTLINGMTWAYLGLLAQ